MVHSYVFNGALLYLLSPAKNRVWLRSAYWVHIAANLDSQRGKVELHATNCCFDVTKQAAKVQCSEVFPELDLERIQVAIGVQRRAYNLQTWPLWFACVASNRSVATATPHQNNIILIHSEQHQAGARDSHQMDAHFLDLCLRVL